MQKKFFMIFVLLDQLKRIYRIMKMKRFGKFLNEMKKSLGDDFSLRDIEPGQEVKYQGSKYYVIDANEIVLELSKEKSAKVGDRSNFFVNRNMFKQWGAIAD